MIPPALPKKKEVISFNLKPNAKNKQLKEYFSSGGRPETAYKMFNISLRTANELFFAFTRGEL